MFTELLKKRRSVRKYSSGPLAEDQIRIITEAALLSPSSRNIRPWEFILVRDPDTLRYLSRAKEGAKMIADAALAIVILGDTEKSDVWVEDCSIAASNILLAVTDIGLGACWVQIRNRFHSGTERAGDYVSARLGVPERFEVEAVIAVGRPEEKRPPLGESDMDWSKVHQERFSA